MSTRLNQMTIFDKYILKKDKAIRKRLEIDVSLYEKLSELSNEVYDASINKLVNIAIMDMIEKQNVQVYMRKDDEITEAHNFLIRESLYKQLEKMKHKYNISIYKLVNIAIYNALYINEE